MDIYDNSAPDYDYEDESSVIRNTEGAPSIWREKSDGFTATIPPNQVSILPLSKNFYINSNNNKAQAYTFTLKNAQNDDPWFQADTRKHHLFSVLPFSNGQITSNFDLTTKPDMYKFVAQTKDGLSDTIYINVTEPIRLSQRKLKKTFQFRAKFRKSRKNTSSEPMYIKPRKFLLEFAIALQKITKDNRPDSFIVTNFWQQKNHIIIDWVNKTISDPCELAREAKAGRDIISPIQLLTKDHDKIVEKSSTLSPAFEEHFIKNLGYLERIKIQKQPKCDFATKSSKLFS